MSKINQDMLDALRQYFKLKDKDNSGDLTVDEILDMIKESDSSIPEDIAMQVLMSMDKNSDGKVSFEEYVAMLEQHMHA